MFDLVLSVVPNPWDPAAPTWYLVSMFDLTFLTREIMQPRLDTTYACGAVVPFPLDHAAPPWLLVGMYDLMFRTREILQSRPYTLQACWICCSEHVRSCSLVLIPCMHDGSVVRSDVPYPWDLAAPSWYGLRSCVPNPWDLAAPSWYLVFRTHEILKSTPDT